MSAPLADTDRCADCAGPDAEIAYWLYTREADGAIRARPVCEPCEDRARSAAGPLHVATLAERDLRGRVPEE